MVTEYSSILNKLKNLNVEKYASTRNFIDGQVTMLSPYISRGILSTNKILQHLINKGVSLKSNEKFIQELAWRDYWQLVWIEKNIDKDLKYNQAMDAAIKSIEIRYDLWTGIQKKINSITLISQKRGKIRGNHFHKKTIQWNYILSGKVILVTKKGKGKKN